MRDGELKNEGGNGKVTGLAVSHGKNKWQKPFGWRSSRWIHDAPSPLFCMSCREEICREARRRREKRINMTLWPDLPLATTRVNSENHFHQQIWPGQAGSSQNRLSQFTPSMTIAEMLRAAGLAEVAPRGLKGRALPTATICRRIRVQSSGAQ